MTDFKNVPNMDRPSVVMAHLMDRAVLDYNPPASDNLALICVDCNDVICAVEAGDTARTLVNTAIGHDCV